MNRLILAFAFLFSGAILASSQVLPPPDSPEVLPLTNDDKLLVFQGYLGRSYFLQISDPSSHLEKWFWAPIIKTNTDEEISYQVDGTADKGFFRIHHTDQVPGTGETLDTADFDNDGISNLNEIDPPGGSATNPLNPDTDSDGLTDGWERAHGFDPNDDGTLDPSNGASGDPDQDGLSNADEQAYATNPQGI